MRETTDSRRAFVRLLGDALLVAPSYEGTITLSAADNRSAHRSSLPMPRQVLDPPNEEPPFSSARVLACHTSRYLQRFSKPPSSNADTRRRFGRIRSF